MNADQQQLEKIYNNFINYEQPFDFFKGLAGYLEYIYSVPKLKSSFDKRMEERNIHYRKIEKLEEKIGQEFNDSQQKIIGLIKRKNIDTSKFQRYVSFPSGFDSNNVYKEFEDFVSGKFNTSGFRSNKIQEYLFEFAINLRKMGYKKEMGGFLVSDEDYRFYYSKINGDGSMTKNEHGNFIFSKTWFDRFESITLLENERLLKPWGSFEKLYKFEKAYDEVLNNRNFWYYLNSGKEIPEFDMQLEVHNMLDICDMMEDLKILKNDSPDNFNLHKTYPTNKIKKLKIELFKPALQIVHSLIMQETEITKNIDHENKQIPMRVLRPLANELARCTSPSQICSVVREFGFEKDAENIADAEAVLLAVFGVLDDEKKYEEIKKIVEKLLTLYADLVGERQNQIFHSKINKILYRGYFRLGFHTLNNSYIIEPFEEPVREHIMKIEGVKEEDLFTRKNTKDQNTERNIDTDSADDKYWLVKKEDNKYYFDENLVYIKNEEARYVSILDAVYTLKPHGGNVAYEKIIQICKERGIKSLKKKTIQQALTGETANLFKYIKDIKRNSAYGVPLFQAKQNGRELAFNNKKHNK